jgi:hypothetical protein
VGTADKINLAIAIIAALSALASLAVVVATFKILQANRDTVSVMRAQVAALTRPYIQVSPWVRHGGMLMLTISNGGTTTARNLRLTFDRAFYFNAAQGEAHNIATYAAFTTPIEALPPKAELAFHLGASHEVLTKTERCPQRFTIRAQYTFDGGQADESTTVDLQPFGRTAMPVDPVVDQLSRLNEQIKQIVGTVRELTQRT